MDDNFPLKFYYLVNCIYFHEKIYDLYSSIIKAKVYKVESIKVAEAAKVIENTQRDVNIALITEFALIFNRLQIDTEEVLKAATKLQRRIHPDVNKGISTERLSQLVNEAKDKILKIDFS